MQVKIKQNGCLELTPETGLENYALKKWFEGFSSDKEETISVNLFVEDETHTQCANKE